MKTIDIGLNLPTKFISDIHKQSIKTELNTPVDLLVKLVIAAANNKSNEEVYIGRLKQIKNKPKIIENYFKEHLND